MGAVVRYVSAINLPHSHTYLSDIHSGGSVFIARSFPQLICEANLPRCLRSVDFSDFFFPCRVPLSDQSFTYAFLPQDLLRDLFASYGMDLPASLTKPDLTRLAPNDAIPTNIDPSKISYLSGLLIPSIVSVSN